MAGRSCGGRCAAADGVAGRPGQSAACYLACRNLPPQWYQVILWVDQAGIPTFGRDQRRPQGPLGVMAPGPLGLSMAREPEFWLLPCEGLRPRIGLHEIGRDNVTTPPVDYFEVVREPGRREVRLTADD